tara:strand:+ start:1264 stop:1440 length:177 start_codon:yes stop_codon:yes gene_type:complete
MNITSAQYVADLRTGENSCINIVLADNTFMSVPLDPDNTDYQKILKWVAEGNTIQEAD